MSKLCKRIIFYAVLFTSVRMFIGSYAVLFIQSRGIEPESIILLKSFQAFIILALEIPLGYLSDRYSRKFVATIAVFFGSLWMGFTAFSPSVLWLYVGEFCNAFSLAAASGVFESILIEHHHKKEETRKILGTFRHFSFMGLILAVLIGSVTPTQESPLFWWIGCFMLLAQFLFLHRLIPSENRSPSSRNLGKFKETAQHIKQFKMLFKSRLAVFIVAELIFGMLFQIMVQYWQIILGSMSVAQDKYFVEFLTLFFIIILLSQLVGSFVGKVFNKKNIFVFLIVTFTVAAICLYNGLKNAQQLLGISAMALFFLSIQTASLVMNGEINDRIGNEYRASILSTISFLIRILIIAVAPFFMYFYTKIDNFIFPLLISLGACTSLVGLLMIAKGEKSAI